MLKWRICYRLEIAAPGILLAPFPDWITLHSPAPLAVFTGITCSSKASPTRVDVSCDVRHRLRLMRRGIERENKLLGLDLPQTGGNHLCANALHAAGRGIGSCISTVCYRSFGPMSAQTAKKLTQTLTSELPLITGMARPRQNALRLPSAAKPCERLLVQIVFGLFKKNRRWRGAIFCAPVPRDVRDGRWSDGRRARGWSWLTSRLRTTDVAIADGCDRRCGPSGARPPRRLEAR